MLRVIGEGVGMVRQVEIELQGEDWSGCLTKRDVGMLSESVENTADDLRIFIWTDDLSPSKTGKLLEAIGNRTVKLTGQYNFRYDPPRTASTGSGQTPRGDFHLYNGDHEIAAWDDAGKARHGFAAGHKLPKKAYDALVSQYPDLHGLKGRLLESCSRAITAGTASVSFSLGDDH